MKLSQYKKDYYEFSGKASEVARKVAFAGIAVIWIFRIDQSPPRPPSELLGPLMFLVFGLAFDLLQYLLGTCIWFFFHRAQERRLSRATTDPDVAHPKLLPLPIHICFIAKLACVALGFAWLALFLFGQWIAK